MVGIEATSLEEYKERIRELLNPEPKGAWFVFVYDVGAYPIGLFEEEIDALRLVAVLGYADTVFWPFGKAWDEIKE